MQENGSSLVLLGGFDRYSGGDGAALSKLFCRRATVVLAAPCSVPGTCNGNETDKHNRGIVDGRGGDGKICRHAEEGNGKDGPGCFVGVDS